MCIIMLFLFPCCHEYYLATQYYGVLTNHNTLSLLWDFPRNNPVFSPSFYLLIIYQYYHTAVMAESLDYSKPSRDPSSSPTPVAAVPDNVSISSLLVLDIPVESDEDDVRRSLEEVPCVSPGGVSRVKVVSSDEKRKYATATIHHHTGTYI